MVANLTVKNRKFRSSWEEMLELAPEAVASPIPSEGTDDTLLDHPIPFHGIIVQAADRYEVDPHLIQAIILAESGYNPKAKSKKGARGLMQLMPATAERFGVEDRLSPAQNIKGGVAYLDWLMGEFDHDPLMILAGYNAGEGAVMGNGGVPPYAETQGYVSHILGI